MLFLISFWESLQYDGAFYGVLLFLLLVVAIVTWLYARTRSAHVIADLKTQLLQVQAQYNDRIFALEDDYKSKLEHARLIVQDLHQQLLKQDATMIAARRNELSNFLVLEYTKAVRHYARVTEPFIREHRPQYLLFIQNHILPFLQQMGDLLAIINQPKILKAANAQPLAFFYPDFDFAFDMIYHYTHFWDFGLRKAARQHAHRLGFGALPEVN